MITTVLAGTADNPTTWADVGFIFALLAGLALVIFAINR